MIRAAAKNHKDVLIVVLEYLKGGQNDQQFRSKLAWKAFQHVAAYDSAVSEWLWKQAEGRKCLFLCGPPYTRSILVSFRLRFLSLYRYERNSSGHREALTRLKGAVAMLIEKRTQDVAVKLQKKMERSVEIL
ncbi:hypothetical protein Bca52824_057271 [Brassica carinata]|uniref:Uncharacterized protein n=1 Tax=Brassica carinata TaxID=52824 RepID=A0A8X7UG26_BRACI|nr:hypothetical protein Bca52824_057271 [Brassica carinata]